MPTVDAISIAAGIVSMLLAAFAMAQATYYFTQAKSAETRTETALAEIRTATQALEKLSGRYLDRLTKHVTEHNSRQSEEIYHLAMLFADSPRTRTEELSKPEQPALTEAQLQSFVSLHILNHHYCALTNIFAQRVLPPLSEHDPEDDSHRQIGLMMEQSHLDFLYFQNALNEWQPLIKANPHSALYEHTLTYQASAVRSLGQVLMEQRKDAG